MKRTCFFLVLLCALLAKSHAQGSNQLPVAVHRLSISANPVKFFIGLPNLEIEYQVTAFLTVNAFAEYLVFEYVLSKAVHPEAVVRLGARWYPFEHTGPEVEGLYVSPFASFAYSSANGESTGFGLGAEGGFKWIFWQTAFALPRLLLTWPVGTLRLIPGFELLLGTAL